MASLEFILQTALKDKEPGNIALALEKVSKHLMQSGLTLPPLVRTPYTNTIAPEDEPPYPGNREIERRIKSYIRWNAMAMVVKSNRMYAGLG